MYARVSTRSLLCCLVFTGAGCDSGGEDGGNAEAAEESESEGDTDEDTTDSGETDPGPLDSDQDGLSDEDEAMIGTDPYLRDTDADSYWDSWELNEGTDPLDVNSRIYTAYWPYNPAKDELEQGTWENASDEVGTPFPRHSFVDQHGDLVDLYDFTNFTGNATDEPAFFIFDLSAQWCVPCHNVASWIAGTDNADTEWIEEFYPTVRGKIHGLRIWWVTFVVQDSMGSAPTFQDSLTWYNMHNDNYIPVIADTEELMWSEYGGAAFPHFFLLDPELRIEYFPYPGQSTSENPYPAVGLVDTLL